MLIPGLPRIPYRRGVGQYEGVVAHATANYTPAANEIAFMSRNWQNAFVHFFVDWTGIYQVADTDYIAYGAGSKANPRYVHVELCQTYDDAQFRQSYVYYTWLLAHILDEGGLSVVDGATLVSHAWVTQNLGGTTHTDPIEYLRSHGVEWTDLIADVQAQYDEKEEAEMSDKPEKKTEYSDVEAGRWSENVIAAVSAAGIMTGYEDGTFRPDQPVTREELAKVANDLLYLINRK